jgi:SAM-dependent methyltransferase
VAQAAHWFDFARFYPEVRRVLRPHGILALWTYGLFSCDARIDALIGHFYTDVVGPYWPPERRFIDERYATLPFPLRELAPPAFEILADLTLPGVLGYLGTWSAVDRYRAARGDDPRVPLGAALAEAWGPPGPRRLRWPIHLRVGTT